MSLTELRNPWEMIGAEDYERHMAHENVMQLQALNKIFEKQYNDYVPKKLIYLGVGTGNGLEYIRGGLTQKIFGIDINREFLDVCAKRYTVKIPNLVLKKMDLNEEPFTDDVADLVIANLFLEYIDPDRFLDQILSVDNGNTVVSIVFQAKGKSLSAVGGSLEVLPEYHREIVFHDLNIQMEGHKYAMIKNNKVKLPGGTEFVRVDYRNNRSANR